METVNQTPSIYLTNMIAITNRIYFFRVLYSENSKMRFLWDPFFLTSFFFCFLYMSMTYQMALNVNVNYSLITLLYFSQLMTLILLRVISTKTISNKVNSQWNSFQWKMSYNPDPSKQVQEVIFTRKKGTHPTQVCILIIFRLVQLQCTNILECYSMMSVKLQTSSQI